MKIYIYPTQEEIEAYLKETYDKYESDIKDIIKEADSKGDYFDDLKLYNQKRIQNSELSLSDEYIKRLVDSYPKFVPYSKKCDIKKINLDIKTKREELKLLNKKRNDCILKTLNIKKISIKGSTGFNFKENKSDVREFLDLFLTTQDRDLGIKVTRNHVFEALWIIVVCYIELMI